MAAATTVLVGIAGLIVGWFVVGTQRVTETLTAERRNAYLKVIKVATLLAEAPQSGETDLRNAVLEAEFLASGRLFKSHRIPDLLQDPGSDEWKARLDEFVILARLETQQNSALSRWWNRRRY